MNIYDFGVMAGHFGETVPIGSDGDLNYDGTVNIFDQGVLASNFGCHAD